MTIPFQLLSLLISGFILESTSTGFSIRASSAVAGASIIALSIPTLSVGGIGAVLAVVIIIIITVIFAVIKLLLRVVIKVELLYLIRANSSANYRS